MAKAVHLSPDTWAALVAAATQTVLQTLQPRPGPEPPAPEIPPMVLKTLELRQTALMTATQLAHTTEDVLQVAQRFLTFLQQGK